MADYLELPADLPVPVDDGAAAHLAGMRVPHLSLVATSGSSVALDELGPGRTIVYLYPRTGVPGEAMPTGWNGIPGARGCTPESCAFRDHHAELLAAGASAVFGLSAQDTAFQREVAARLHLPFALLADPEREVGAALNLPTFEVDGMTLYRRLTLVITDGVIEHVFYPVFPPDRHASEVLTWLQR